MRKRPSYGSRVLISGPWGAEPRAGPQLRGASLTFLLVFLRFCRITSRLSDQSSCENTSWLTYDTQDLADALGGGFILTECFQLQSFSVGWKLFISLVAHFPQQKVQRSHSAAGRLCCDSESSILLTALEQDTCMLMKNQNTHILQISWFFLQRYFQSISCRSPVNKETKPTTTISVRPASLCPCVSSMLKSASQSCFELGYRHTPRFIFYDTHLPYMNIS